MIVLLWIVNFAISWFNAWACGKTWNESKHSGGWPHFLNWLGAIMSACGFTWCYLAVAIFFGGTIPYEHDDGTSAPLLTMEQVQAVAQLGYLIIIGPIIGSGLGIMVHSWGVFYRRRTIGGGAVAGWNTFANIYNISSALSYVPEASSGVADFFFGKGSDSKDGKGWVLFLVLLALIGGILTTRAILLRTAKATAIDRAHRYEWEALAAGRDERKVRI